MSDDEAGEFNTGEGGSEKCLLEDCGMSDDEAGEFNTRVIIWALSVDEASEEWEPCFF